MTVRPFRDADLGAAIAVVRAIDPTYVTTPASLALDLAIFPGECFVAEVDGEIVGWAPVHRRAEDVFSFWIGVLPEFRRRGLGSELFSAIEAQFAGSFSRAYADGEAGCRFLEARGYETAGELHLATLELAAAPVVTDVSGFDAVPLASLLDRLPDVHRTYAAARADIPLDHPIAPVLFDAFVAEIDGGLLDCDGSVVVLDGADPVAFSLVFTDRESGRADTDLTGTLAPYRGRGLARYAKTDSLRRLFDLGVRVVTTANDETNAPMRALNESLGFKPAATWTRYSR